MKKRRLVDVTKGTGKCKTCGRKLRNPRSVSIGYGPLCAEAAGVEFPPETDEERLERLVASMRRQYHARRMRALKSSNAGQGILFPDLDQPLIDQAEKERKGIKT